MIANQTIYIVKVAETRTRGTRKYIALQADGEDIINITFDVAKALGQKILYEIQVSSYTANGDAWYLAGQLDADVIELS